MVKTRPGPTDRIMRVAYRLASCMIRLDRRLRLSHGRGVKVIVTSPEGAILLVSHTYGNRHWTLPGGGVHTGEDPQSGAAREIYEELGTADLQFNPLGTYPAHGHRRTEVISVFSCILSPDKTEPRPVEIDATVWVKEKDLPEDTDPKVATALGLLAGHRAEQMAARRNVS